jgi:hypothetical protein
MAEVSARPDIGMRPKSKTVSHASILIFEILRERMQEKVFGVGTNVGMSREFR